MYTSLRLSVSVNTTLKVLVINTGGAVCSTRVHQTLPQGRYTNLLLH